MSLGLVAATAILAAGVTDDFRSRKFHNWLFLLCAGLGTVITLILQGAWGLPLGLLGFAAGIAVFLPLVLMNIMGAGDMKLMSAFGIVAGWEAVLSVAILSLFWGALFGLVQVTLSGQLKRVFSNLLSIVTGQDRASIELHKIPFTVAIFMGWLTHLVYAGAL